MENMENQKEKCFQPQLSKQTCPVCPAKRVFQTRDDSAVAVLLQSFIANIKGGGHGGHQRRQGSGSMAGLQPHFIKRVE